MEPVSDGPFKGQKFQLMSIIISFRLREGSASVSHWSLQIILLNLSQYSTKDTFTGVSVQFKLLSVIGVGQHRRITT